MKNLIQSLAVAASATALIAGCTTTGLSIPGIADNSSGCRTIYVYRGGGIQPVSNCGGGGGVPRDDLDKRSKSVQPQAFASLQENAPVLQDANPPAPVTPISAAAKATAPAELKASYPGANEMLENADMSAFMGRVRTDFSKKENAGAWGYMILDALAADDPATAQVVLTAMAERPPPEILSANHLRPWVFAANGRKPEATIEMGKARRILPAATLLGHRALLAEGMGDTDQALAVYGEVSTELTPPKPAETQEEFLSFLSQSLQFQNQVVLLARKGELLYSLNRNEEAAAVFQLLLAASPDNTFITDRIADIKAGKDRKPVRTLKQALAVALSDEAEIIEQRQNFSGIGARGGKIPFNYLLSSLRQSALLLDPDNGDIRLSEVGALYAGGKFEPALRIAQIGNPPKEQSAALWSTAGLAALELGSPDTLVAMTDRALKIDSRPEAKLQAAGALTSAGKTEKALQLIDQAIKAGLNPDQQVFAEMSKGQANLQAGNVSGAVEAARAARKLKDDDTSKQFLASMLVEQNGSARQEGITLMHEMLAEAPNNSGLMNNLGYCLVDEYANDAELEEGFKLLKQAIRLTPDEPNLLDSIGWAYYQYGDFREAKRYVGLALEAYEPFDHWELSDHFGDISWRLGEQEAARKAWQHSLDSYPPSHNRAAIEAKLKEGLKTPAPARRDTPEVPLKRDQDRETSDI